MEGEIGVDRVAGCMALSDLKTTFYRQQMDGPYELQSDWVGVAFLIHSIASQQVDGPYEPQLDWTLCPL